MIHYFGLKMPISDSYSLNNPIRFWVEPDASNTALIITIEWPVLDELAQSLGYPSYSACTQDALSHQKVFDAMDQRIQDNLPYYHSGLFRTPIADEAGEQWFIYLPKHKRITANFIEI